MDAPDYSFHLSDLLCKSGEVMSPACFPLSGLCRGNVRANLVLWQELCDTLNLGVWHRPGTRVQ